MEKKLIIANWKMNPTDFKQAGHIIHFLEKELKSTKNTEVVICPPFIWINSFKNKKKISLGAQDCFYQERGSYTGEISPLMLKDSNCAYAIIGHSERRKYFKETDEIVNMKIKAALKAKLKPILCIGEEAKDDFNEKGELTGETSLVIVDQLKKGLLGIPQSRVKEITIAYEPVWAIGTGNSCSAVDAMKSALLIKKTLTSLYDRNTAENIKIIYGGSVNSTNSQSYLKEAQLNGLLIGGASLKASEFLKIIKLCSSLEI